MINKEELTVNGYVFATPEDAELAKGEMKKIAYIESHTDMTNVEIVRSVYAKALESRAFQTPIGLEYMHTLWERVKNASGENEPEPIPLYTTFRRISLKDSKPTKKRLTKAQKEELTLKMKYRNAVLIAVILGVLAFAMFIITLNGSTPNVLNYKRAITNEYAAWEQDLTNREAVIRDKERQLNIEP